MTLFFSERVGRPIMADDQPASDESQNEGKPFKYNPILLYDSPGELITLNMLRHNMRSMMGAGFEAFCFDFPHAELHENIRVLSMMQPSIKSCIDELKSGKYTFISHYMREMYGPRAIAFEENLYQAIQQKIEFYEVILGFQNSNNLKPYVYSIDTSNESIPYLEELKKMYFSDDFDNPAFNSVRNKSFAENIEKALLKHDGGIIIVLGADHFGVQAELSQRLSKEQSKQLKSFYHYSQTDPCALRASKHLQDLLNGDQKALKRYPLGLTVVDKSKHGQFERADYQEMFNQLL